jgi:hypothetical protein
MKILEAPVDRTFEARFWAKVDTSGGVDACWPWLARRSARGYGQFWIRGTNTSATRAALELKLGRPLSDDEQACHTCDNPPCVNPTHLFAGSAQDNMDDRATKGRTAAGDRHGSRLHPHRVPRGDRHGSRTRPERLQRGQAWHSSHGNQARGEGHPSARLTEEAVREIRRLSAEGLTPSALSRAYGVTRQAVNHIVARRSWRHVA